MGDLALRYYHEPRSQLRKMIQEGGPLEQRRTEQGRREMVVAASLLPPLSSPADGPELEVSFLTGSRFWYQTLFCIYSLQSHSNVRITPIVYDDGSLTDANVVAILRVIPWARFVSACDVEALLDDQLPATRYPVLRARRLDFPLLRKLCDIRLGRDDWVMFLDSDMLFFRRPTMLLDWLAAPERPIYLVDIQRAYGYSPELMQRLCGHEEPERVNTGICGLRGAAIDWESLEYWCRAMLEIEGPAYLQEQALTAMLLAGKSCLRLPEEDYKVLPTLIEGRNPSGILHHYVSHSKRSYFQYGWRRIIADGGMNG
jgi:hypothetical protein